MNETGNDKHIRAEAVPTTAREFERWLSKQPQARWPTELVNASQRALLTLKSMDQPVFEQISVLQRASAKDLQAFAAAYAEWRG